MKIRKSIYQFQVGYMLNPELNINKAFKEQVDINLEKYFSGATIMPLKKFYKKGTLVFFQF